VDKLEIRLWQGDIAGTETDHPPYWLILDPTEQQHASSINNAAIRRRYVEIHARLRSLLGDVVNVKPELLRIAKGEFGKPYLIDYPNLAFNLSHTRNKMVVAIGHDCDLGVDIEHCKPRANMAALVDKCFADVEKNHWQQLPETQQTLAFYQFWTRKEAFVKAVGRGIALGLNHCVINPENINEFLAILEAYGQRSEWLVQGIDMGEAFCGALVVKDKGGNYDITGFNISWLSDTEPL
jgi:4'-phosphopantetheinyl transferase